MPGMITRSLISLRKELFVLKRVSKFFKAIAESLFNILIMLISPGRWKQNVTQEKMEGVKTSESV